LRDTSGLVFEDASSSEDFSVPRWIDDPRRSKAVAMHTWTHPHRGRWTRLDALEPPAAPCTHGHLVLATARSSDEALQLAGVVRGPDAARDGRPAAGLMDSIQAGTRIWARFGIPVILLS